MVEINACKSGAAGSYNMPLLYTKGDLTGQNVEGNAEQDQKNTNVSGSWHFGAQVSKKYRQIKSHIPLAGFSRMSAMV